MMRSLVWLFVFALCHSALSASNPDFARNVTEIIQARGYRVEQHDVLTPDGFYLSVQRIPGPKGSHGNAPGPAVYLQHGLLDNSATWIYEEVLSESLGYVLADAGYDVWMANVRGNTYSMRHTTLTPKDAAFWNWSYDEMIQYDLPSVIAYILEATNRTSLSYIGHSQGTLMGFAGFTDREVAAPVDIFIALAPVAWVHHCESVLLNLMAKLNLQFLFGLFGVHDFSPDTALLKKLLPEICGITPTACIGLMSLVMGYDTANLNATMLPVFLAHEPSGTSVKNMIHWSQGVDSESFQMFDYGKSGNMKAYNQATPPQYNPANITVPVAIFNGQADYLADPTDVANLVEQLGAKMVFQKTIPSYEHMDFVWGTDAFDAIYTDILQLLATYAKQ